MWGYSVVGGGVVRALCVRRASMLGWAGSSMSQSQAGRSQSQVSRSQSTILCAQLALVLLAYISV
jgi:hypothetical protein